MKQRASVVVIQHPEILLLHRYKNGEEFYCLPGGKIEKHETPEHAATRELEEEIGIVGTIDHKLLEFTNTKTERIEHIFIMNNFVGEPKIGDVPSKKTATNYATLEWVSLYELRYMDVRPMEVKEALIEKYARNFRWDKLVRDKLPEIIAARGRTSTWHTANEEEYWHELKKKLREEVDEFIKTEGKKELADVDEIIRAIYTYKNYTNEEIEKIRQERFLERGGFEKRIILETSTGD